MTEIISNRVTGQIDGNFVLFLIGMRSNKPWKPHKRLPVLRAMPKMLRELESAPQQVGFLGHNGLGGTIVQYWRSLITLSGMLTTATRCTGPLGSSSIDA